MTEDFGKTLKLLALVALEGKKQKEQIALLDRAGYGQGEIAEIVDSTPKAVSVRLAELRKAKKSNSTRRGNTERKGQS